MTLRDAIRSEMLTLVIEQNADLRSRLSLFADFVCEGCGCAPAEDVCLDCWAASQPQDGLMHGRTRKASASISVGMRALCGRRILEGC